MALIKSPYPKRKKKVDVEKLRRHMAKHDTVKMTVAIPFNVHMQFKDRVARQRTSLNAVVLDMVLKYLEN
jgi:hypothetical protein